MKPRKLVSIGQARGASLPPAFQKGKDHTEAVRVPVEVFQAPPEMVRNPKVFPLNHLLGNAGISEASSTSDGPMDLDLLALEAQAMEAAGIPPELLLGYDRTDFGHPIPGGGAA